MNVSIGDRWEDFVNRIVRAGRYGSASEVVREGLRLVEEREAKLQALRTMLDASIAAGGEASDADKSAPLQASDSACFFLVSSFKNFACRGAASLLTLSQGTEFDSQPTHDRSIATPRRTPRA